MHEWDWTHDGSALEKRLPDNLTARITIHPDEGLTLDDLGDGYTAEDAEHLSVDFFHLTITDGRGVIWREDYLGAIVSDLRLSGLENQRYAESVADDMLYGFPTEEETLAALA